MFNPKYDIVIAVFTVCIVCATCDYYTSINGLEKLLQAEEFLLDSLKDYKETNQNYDENNFVKTLAFIKDEHKKAKSDTLSYLTNPISAFQLIKRFVVDWGLVDEYIKKDANTEDFASRLTGFMNGSFEAPTEDDLKGAALGMVRLQETYKLNVSDLVEGRILGTNYDFQMTVSDCRELGISLYQAEEYEHSFNWLVAALIQLNKTSVVPKESKIDLLGYLSAVHFKLDNSKMAFRINNEILAIDATNIDALENKEIYEKKAFEQRIQKKVHKELFAKRKEPSLKELNELTCRGERHLTPTEQRPLRCMYLTNGKPYRLIAPFRAEQLSLDPPILRYYDVITDKYIKRLIEEVELSIERSQVGGAMSFYSEVRTSKSSWLYYDEKKEFLSPMVDLLNDITGLSMSGAEALQAANYGIGGHYGPHYDFFLDLEAFAEYDKLKGNRIATALFYISDIELGGATAFPFLKLAVPPLKGSMVFWYNLHDSLEQDYRMRHAGCPVLKGSKWILTQWYRTGGQEFLRPCSLEEHGEAWKHYENVE